MKTIDVVAALIVHDGRIFATQRGHGEWKDFREFPGGKIEPGETPEDVLLSVQHHFRLAYPAGARGRRMAGPRASAKRAVVAG